MKLKALDQIHISSVQSDSLRPGQEFVVSDAAGAELLKFHSDKLAHVGDEEPTVKAEPAPTNKTEAPPENKAESAPANKADNRRKNDKGE